MSAATDPPPLVQETQIDGADQPLNKAQKENLPNSITNENASLGTAQPVLNSGQTDGADSGIGSDSPKNSSAGGKVRRFK